ncbi:hypothetical protein QBC46DRAFT_409631 [Diplogelasinospora grovesii]|uniref:Uncharacterized protein n=1 Tax=Diplogelasinospora grovesii TaxID=303347 RepID=A0AAN6N7A2_9PEZI|nr:hypothetical protein QBC46DRAFT_409631 [Diplogelasinospora grovesii]
MNHQQQAGRKRPAESSPEDITDRLWKKLKEESLEVEAQSGGQSEPDAAMTDQADMVEAPPAGEGPAHHEIECDACGNVGQKSHTHEYTPEFRKHYWSQAKMLLELHEKVQAWEECVRKARDKLTELGGRLEQEGRVKICVQCDGQRTGENSRDSYDGIASFLPLEKELRQIDFCQAYVLFSSDGEEEAGEEAEVPEPRENYKWAPSRNRLHTKKTYVRDRPSQRTLTLVVSCNLSSR